MDYYFNTELAKKYKSNSQRVRVMSESWVAHNIFCPICGNPHISNLKIICPLQIYRVTIAEKYSN